MKKVSFSSKAEKPKATREQALRVARQLGCRGVHQGHDGSWMPCGSMEELEAIPKGKSEYLAAGARHRFIPEAVITHRTEKFDSKSLEYYMDRQQAMEVSKRNGCSGVRTIVLGGTRYYAPCAPKAGYEKLGERGITGIETVDGGGLVAASVGGKDEKPDDISEKFVANVSRSTDPDVFTNPDSARVRARNLGCIGIRRYVANDGKTVWMPCSNNSDYRRLMNVRGDGMPRRRGSRKELLADSLVGVKGAARPKRRLPALSSADINTLAIQVREHNVGAKTPAHRTNLRDVRTVFLRGLEDGDRSQAMKRVNQFLSMMASDEPLPKGKRTDFDLVPATHPSKNQRSARSKSAGPFSEGQIGFKQGNGCCPQPVTRYHAIKLSPEKATD